MHFCRKWLVFAARSHGNQAKTAAQMEVVLMPLAAQPHGNTCLEILGLWMRCACFDAHTNLLLRRMRGMPPVSSLPYCVSASLFQSSGRCRTMQVSNIPRPLSMLVDPSVELGLEEERK